MTVVDIKGKGSPMSKIDDPELLERVSSAIGWLQDQYSALGSWPKVARLVGGYDDSTFSTFASLNYQGRPHKVLAAIEKARDLQNARNSELFTPSFCETSVARRIRKVMKQTRVRGELGLLAGKSGMGKTTAIRAIVAGDTRTIYIRANATYSGKVWGAFLSLCDALKVVGGGRGVNPAQLYETVRTALLNRRAMLVIDEAQLIARGTLDALRTLSEDSETPILFSGNENLYEFGFLNGASPAAYDQFASRCRAQDHLQPSEITANDVALIASQVLSDAVLEETAGILLAQARSSGAFRRLHSVLQRAFEKANGQSVTAGHVIDAANRMTKLRGTV